MTGNYSISSRSPDENSGQPENAVQLSDTLPQKPGRTSPEKVTWEEHELERITPAYFKFAGERFGPALWQELIELMTPNLINGITDFLRYPKIAATLSSGVAYDMAKFAIEILESYDEMHSTNHAIEEGARLLQTLQPHPFTRNSESLTSTITGCFYNSSEPQKIKLYFDALYESPCIAGCYFQTPYYFYNMIDQLQPGAAFTPPSPETLEYYVDGCVRFNEELIRTWREFPEYLSRFIKATSMTQMANEYFARMGDDSRAERYRRETERLNAASEAIYSSRLAE